MAVKRYLLAVAFLKLMTKGSMLRAADGQVQFERTAFEAEFFELGKDGGDAHAPRDEEMVACVF
jgi:hypothetical protein